MTNDEKKEAYFAELFNKCMRLMDEAARRQRMAQENQRSQPCQA